MNICFCEKRLKTPCIFRALVRQRNRERDPCVVRPWDESAKRFLAMGISILVKKCISKSRLCVSLHPLFTILVSYISPHSLVLFGSYSCLLIRSSTDYTDFALSLSLSICELAILKYSFQYDFISRSSTMQRILSPFPHGTRSPAFLFAVGLHFLSSNPSSPFLVCCPSRTHSPAARNVFSIYFCTLQRVERASTAIDYSYLRVLCSNSRARFLFTLTVKRSRHCVFSCLFLVCQYLQWSQGVQTSSLYQGWLRV